MLLYWKEKLEKSVNHLKTVFCFSTYLILFLFATSTNSTILWLIKTPKISKIKSFQTMRLFRFRFLMSNTKITFKIHHFIILKPFIKETGNNLTKIANFMNSGTTSNIFFCYNALQFVSIEIKTRFNHVGTNLLTV